MIFNKKLIALAVAITCASSIVAMEEEQVKNKGYTITIPDYDSLKKATFKRGVAVTKWAADTAYGLVVRADDFSGQRFSKVGNWALGYAQSADAYIAGKVQGSRFEAFYAWPKDVCVSLHDTLYPKSE